MKTLRAIIPLTVAFAATAWAVMAQNPPVITSQPDSAVAIVGNTTMLSVTASGAGPLSYQWFFNGAPAAINSVITTVAGDFCGDGDPATNAALDYPQSVAVDAAGDLFITDENNGVIRRIGTDGIITSVVGNGAFGYKGDGGPATNASFRLPASVAVDVSGNLFIADFGDNVIRKVGTNGIITTVAGNGTAGYLGDGGAATNAEMSEPYGVAVDATGNLFIADSGNNVIRKVGTDGIITTAAGNGTVGYLGDGGAATNAELSGSLFLAVNVAGDLFVADEDNNVIREVGTNGIITTVAGNGTAGYAGDGGAATNALLYKPVGVAVDASGNLFIAVDNRIRKVGTNGIITVFAGRVTAGYSGDGGLATDALFSTPIGIAVDTTGNLFIADFHNNRIRKVATDDIISTVAGDGSTTYSGDGGSAVYALFYGPGSVAVDAAGNLLIADTGNNRIRKVGPNGIIATVVGIGSYGFSGDGGAATNASLSSPVGLAFDAGGNLYFSDLYNGRVRKMGTNGIITTVAGNGGAAHTGDGGRATSASFNNPSAVAMDDAGNVYVADEFNNCIRKVGTNGIISTVAGDGSMAFSGDGGAATNASLYYPNGVGVDTAGDLYIADSYNNRIRKVGTNGIISTVAGIGPSGGFGWYSGDGGAATNAELSYPSAVKVDTVGNIYIIDRANNRTRKVGTNGIITTAAGNGAEGFSGDGGQAANASFMGLDDVAFDLVGNFYLADQGNNDVRKVTVSNLTLASGGRNLVISNSNVGNAGGYDVVISNPYGSVTSSVASLRLAAGQFTGDTVANGSVNLAFQGVAGVRYAVLYTTNLTPPVIWTPISTNTADNSGNVTFMEPKISGTSSKFYTISTP